MVYFLYQKKKTRTNELMNDGFSEGLDKSRIGMLVNAVIPEITHYLFGCIKINEHENKRN